MHNLESLLPDGSKTNINNADAVIYDGHATIQVLNPPPLVQTVIFRHMADNFTTHINQANNMSLLV